MKKYFVILSFALTLVNVACNAQEEFTSEKYGKSLNIGVGLGYYKYVGYSRAVAHADYELQIGNGLTVAPSISIYNYEGHSFWGDSNHEYKEYRYSETVVPLGLKVSFYFDELLGAGNKWDFYSAGSLGTTIRKTNWENNYYGKHNIEPGTGPVYIDAHIGSEYHLTKHIGLQLDISTGVSTLGIAIHL